MSELSEWLVDLPELILPGDGLLVQAEGGGTAGGTAAPAKGPQDVSNGAGMSPFVIVAIVVVVAVLAFVAWRSFQSPEKDTEGEVKAPPKTPTDDPDRPSRDILADRQVVDKIEEVTDDDSLADVKRKKMQKQREKSYDDVKAELAKRRAAAQTAHAKKKREEEKANAEPAGDVEQGSDEGASEPDSDAGAPEPDEPQQAADAASGQGEAAEDAAEASAEGPAESDDSSAAEAATASTTEEADADGAEDGDVAEDSAVDEASASDSKATEDAEDAVSAAAEPAGEPDADPVLAGGLGELGGLSFGDDIDSGWGEIDMESFSLPDMSLDMNAEAEKVEAEKAEAEKAEAEKAEAEKAAAEKAAAEKAAAEKAEAEKAAAEKAEAEKAEAEKAEAEKAEAEKAEAEKAAAEKAAAEKAEAEKAEAEKAEAEKAEAEKAEAEKAEAEKAEAEKAEAEKAEAARSAAAARRAEAERVSSLEKTEGKSLADGIQKTKGGFIARLGQLFKRQSEIDDDLLDELEEVLYTSDIGHKSVEYLLEKVRTELNDDEAADSSRVWQFIRQTCQQMLMEHDSPLVIKSEPGVPFVILVVGVNGVGKTTTIGKLAMRYTEQGHKVLMVAGDTFRAAAVEQLQEWGERTGLSVHAGAAKADPASVVFEGIERGVSEGFDVVICDTAGRLTNKKNLMKELAKISRVSGKALEGAPHETLLVLDANTGRMAVQQARLFQEVTDISGLVLTKLDGTAKGGVVIGISRELKVPLRYIGIGEGVYDLRPFDADEFVEALFL